MASSAALARPITFSSAFPPHRSRHRQGGRGRRNQGGGGGPPRVPLSQAGAGGGGGGGGKTFRSDSNSGSTVPLTVSFFPGGGRGRGGAKGAPPPGGGAPPLFFFPPPPRHQRGGALRNFGFELNAEITWLRDNIGSRLSHPALSDPCSSLRVGEAMAWTTMSILPHSVLSVSNTGVRRLRCTRRRRAAPASSQPFGEWPDPPPEGLRL